MRSDYSSVKFTVTVMMTLTGGPASSVIQSLSKRAPSDVSVA